jgi:hypothetical protein
MPNKYSKGWRDIQIKQTSERDIARLKIVLITTLILLSLFVALY